MASAVPAPPTDFFSQIITMMKRTIHWLIALVTATPLLATAQDAQFVPYRGGSADGQAVSTLSGTMRPIGVPTGYRAWSRMLLFHSAHPMPVS
jgi:hypothetical protein